VFIHQQNRSIYLPIAIVTGAIGLGAVVGLLAGAKPLYLGILLVAALVFLLFFLRFEQTVLGLLILRSAIDSFVGLQLPSVFAVGLNLLIIVYVLMALATDRSVRTDRFWWFFAVWWLIQGLWLVLLAMGALGHSASLMSDSIREWVRLFSWVMVYLLILQLRGRVAPQTIISALFLSLIIPIAVAVLQMVAPSVLPNELSPVMGLDPGAALPDEGVRIRGTIGHANSFTTYLLLFIALTLWKIEHSKQRWLWLPLLGTLIVCLVAAKALFGVVMLGVFMLVLMAPRLNGLNLIGGAILFTLVIALFASSEFGRQRLGSIANTPLLNPDIDISRAILLSNSDYNSFNWRISQWYTLLNAWKQYPIFGYGLGLSIHTSGNNLLPHNDYIRSLVEGGVVGFSAFIGLLGMQAMRLLRLRQRLQPGPQRNFCWTLFAMFVAMCVGMITENIWSHTLLFFYWWTLWVAASWDWEQLTSQPVSVPET
jgi:O-antigen ligase